MSINNNGLIHFVQVSKAAGWGRWLPGLLWLPCELRVGCWGPGNNVYVQGLSIVETVMKFLSVSAWRMRSQRNPDVARQTDGAKRGAQRWGQQGILGESNGGGPVLSLYSPCWYSLKTCLGLLDCFSQTTDYSRTFLKTRSDSKIPELNHFFLQVAFYMFSISLPSSCIFIFFLLQYSLWIFTCVVLLLGFSL